MPTEPAIKRVVAFFDGQNLFYAAKYAFGYNWPNYALDTKYSFRDGRLASVLEGNVNRLATADVWEISRNEDSRMRGASRPSPNASTEITDRLLALAAEVERC